MTDPAEEFRIALDALGDEWTDTKNEIGTAYMTDPERRCANGQFYGCLALFASFAGGILLGYVAYLWVSACP